MTEPRRRGRPRSTGTLLCDRCENLVPKIRVRWPDGAICGACFSLAVNTYGVCAHCAEERMLPGRSPSGEQWGVTLLVDGRYQEGTTGRDVYESQEVH